MAIEISIFGPVIARFVFLNMEKQVWIRSIERLRKENGDWRVNKVWFLEITCEDEQS